MFAVEGVEGGVDLEQIDGFGGGGGTGFADTVEGDGDGGIAFFGIAGADVIDEDATDGLGGDREEVGAAGEIGVALVDELHVGFMDEGGGLEGMVAGLAGHLAAGDEAHFVVDEGEEAVEGSGIAKAPGVEELGDFVGAGHRRIV